MEDRTHQTDPAAVPDDEQRWVQPADVVLIVNRETQFRGYTDERAVQLSPSEGTVMRRLQREPSVPPSRTTNATGLRRTICPQSWAGSNARASSSDAPTRETAAA